MTTFWPEFTEFAGVTYLESEDAVTMDEVFLGIEEEVQRMYAAALAKHCKLSDIICRPWEEVVTRWKRSDGVQISLFVSINLPAVLTPYKTAAFLISG